MRFKRIFIMAGILILGLSVTASAQNRSFFGLLPADTLVAKVVIRAGNWPLPTGPNAAGFFDDWRFGGGPMLDSLGHPVVTIKDSSGTNRSTVNYLIGGWGMFADSATYLATYHDTGAVYLPQVLVTGTDSAGIIKEEEAIILINDGSEDHYIAYVSIMDTLFNWKLGVSQEETGTLHGATSGLYFYSSGSGAASGLTPRHGRSVWLVANKAGTLDSICVMRDDSVSRANGTAFNAAQWNQFRWKKASNGVIEAYVNGVYKGSIAAASLPTNARMAPIAIGKRTASTTARQSLGYVAYIGYTHVYPDLR